METNLSWEDDMARGNIRRVATAVLVVIVAVTAFQAFGAVP